MKNPLLSNPNLKLVWVGNLAAILSIVAAIPFVAHITWYKTTHSISYIWLVFAILTSLMWLTFAIVNGIQPTLISSSLLLLGYVYILIFKIVLESNGWAHHQQPNKS